MPFRPRSQFASRRNGPAPYRRCRAVPRNTSTPPSAQIGRWAWITMHRITLECPHPALSGARARAATAAKTHALKYPSSTRFTASRSGFIQRVESNRLNCSYLRSFAVDPTSSTIRTVRCIRIGQPKSASCINLTFGPFQCLTAQLRYPSIFGWRKLRPHEL